MSPPRTICLDFDGTLHPYTAGCVGPIPADEPPTPEAQMFLRHLRADGYKVVVQSARASFPEGLAGIEGWLAKWIAPGMVAAVTAVKPAAVAYVDDRAVPFTGDWQAVLNAIKNLDR